MERSLTQQEAQKLNEMNLAPKVANAVRSIWEKSGEVKYSDSKLTSIIGSIILPIIASFFVLGLQFPFLRNALDDFGLFLVWLMVGFIVLLIAIFQFPIVFSGRRDVILHQVVIKMWYFEDWKVAGYFRMACVFVLIGVVAYCGHLFTAWIYFTFWFVGFKLAKSVREKIRNEIKIIENE